MAEETYWPTVWAQYWKEKDDHDVKTWDNEFELQFGDDITEVEVCGALRFLGTSGDFNNYPPRISAVMAAIKRAKPKVVEPLRRESKACPYCEDSGWVDVPIVVEGFGPKRRRRFPKEVEAVVPNTFEGGGRYRIVDLELSTIIQYPCPYCDSNKCKVPRAPAKLMQDYKEWVLTLSDDNLRKPVGLRSRPSELQRIPENSLESVAVDDEEDIQDGW